MAPPPFRRGQARTPADDSFSSSNPSNSPPSGSSRRSGPQVTPSTPSRLSTVHERPIGGSSASSPSTRPRVANSSGSTAAPASKQAPQPPKKKTLRRKILAYIHQRINFSGHSDSDTITVLDRGYNASRDQTCQDVAAKQSAPRWRQAQGTVVSQSGIAATSQLFASGQTPIAYTPPRIVTPPILSRSPSPPSSPTPPPSLEAHRDLKDAERAMLVSGDTNLLSSSTEFGPGELAHTVRLLQKSMEKKDKEVEELQRKVEKLNREVERLNRNREEMVTWSNSVVQELSTWGEAQATHLATKEDVMRRDFEKMFDEAMERRTRELAVMRKESRILTWFSLALEISKANNPNLRGKDNSTISLPDLEKEVSNVNKAKFRMKHGKFGTALCMNESLLHSMRAMDRNDVAHPHHDRAGMLDRLLNDEVFRGANEYLEPVDYYRWATTYALSIGRETTEKAIEEIRRRAAASQEGGVGVPDTLDVETWLDVAFKAVKA